MVFTLIISLAIVLILMLIFSLIMGKKYKGIENWNVGGRSLPIYVQIGTQFATVMGGAVIVGLVGTAYISGFASLTYGLLTAIGLIPFLAMAKWLRNSEFESLPDALKSIYGKNKFFQFLVIVCTLIVPFGWMVTQLVGFGKIFSEITGFSEGTVVIVFALISLAFVLPAGMTTVAWTDFLFGCLMIVGAIISLIFLFNMSGDWSQIIEQQNKKYTTLPNGLYGIGGMTILFWVFGVMPGNLTNQQLYQRIYAADNSKNAKISIIATAILFTLATGWSSIMGIGIKNMNPHLANPENATGWFLGQTPSWFTIMFSIFIVSTIMSTLSSAVQSVVVTITKDIYLGLIINKKSHPNQVKLSRIISVIVLLFAVILSVLYPQALGWIVASFSYSVSALIVPILLGFVLKDKNILNVYGGIASIVCGVVGSAIAHIIGTSLPYVLFGILASVVGLLVVSIVTKKIKGDVEYEI